MGTRLATTLGFLGIPLAALLIQSPATAQDCATCQKFHCPPILKYCLEGKPRICFTHGCAKPVCNPCTNPNFGYFETCWTPWPWAPNYSHCPVQPPAATVVPTATSYHGISIQPTPAPATAQPPTLGTPRPLRPEL